MPKKRQSSRILPPSVWEADTRGKLPRSARDKEHRKDIAIPKKKAQRKKDRAAMAAKFVTSIDTAFQEEGCKRLTADAFESWMKPYITSKFLTSMVATADRPLADRFCTHVLWSLWKTKYLGEAVIDRPLLNPGVVHCTDDFIMSLFDDIYYEGWFLDYGKFIDEVVVKGRLPEDHYYLSEDDE